MSKHTPGPWVARGLDSRSPYVCADEGKKWGGLEICNLFDDVTPVDSVSGQWLKPLPNAAANARLIAAAPDMHALLTMAVARLGLEEFPPLLGAWLEEARHLLARIE